MSKAGKLDQQIVKPGTSPIFGNALSPQEKRVLALLVGDGEPTMETVGRALEISTETTKSHVKRIREKLGPGHGTQTALLKYAIRKGLVPPIVPDGYVLVPLSVVKSIK
jgi:DNA-binding CsgD family transcriptional regulator